MPASSAIFSGHWRAIQQSTLWDCSFWSPLLWMMFTAFKSNQDVFHTPPRWLPYDNVRVDVNGEQLPLYNVKTEQGVRQLAAVKIVEGLGTFVDPANPDQTMEYEIQQGDTKIAEPVMHVYFHWKNFPDAMERGSRPGIGASFWVYFKNSLIIAFFSIIGTLCLECTGRLCFCADQVPRA